jgi:hypothetical protein
MVSNLQSAKHMMMMMMMMMMSGCMATLESGLSVKTLAQYKQL